MLPFRIVLDPPDEDGGTEGRLPDTPESEGLPAEAAGVDDAVALRFFRRAAHVEPHDPDYYYIMSQALARLGRHAEAAAACREALRLNVTHAEYSCGLGEALWHLGREAEAEEVFREALSLAPSDARATKGLAKTLLRSGRWADALPVLREALRLDRRRVELRGDIGVALAGLGQIPEALRDLRAAATRRPRDADLQYNLALVLSASGRHRDAVSVLRRSAHRRPQDADALLDLAEALHDAGRLDEAAAALDEAVERDPARVGARPRTREIREALLSLQDSERPRARRRWSAWNLLVAIEDLLRGTGTVGARLVRGLGLFAVVAVLYTGARIAPPLFSRFLLADDVAGIAGASVASDVDVLDRLMHAVRERGLEEHVREDSFQIHTRAKWRRIACQYQVPVRLVPRLTWVLRFRIDVERPYIPAPDPLVL